MSFLLAAGLMMLFFVVMLLIGYIPFSIGLYRMAEKCGIDNPWLAFIPFANLYVMGLIVRELQVQNYNIPRPELVLPAAAILNLVIGRIPFIGGLYGLALFLLMGLALYRLNCIFKKDSALLFTLLWLIPFLGPFLILSVSKYDPEY